MTGRTGHLIIATMTSALLLGASGAEAGRGKGGGDYVVAESHFGNGVVAGPVRRTRLGPQVRLPGGSWIYCERSCSETLRVNTVDFWQNEKGAGGPNAVDQESGLLNRWLRFEGRF